MFIMLCFVQSVHIRKYLPTYFRYIYWLYVN